MNPTQREAAGLEFLSWLKRFEPRAYSYVKSRIGSPPGQGIFALNELNGLAQIDPFGGVGVSAPVTSPSGTSGGGLMDYISQGLELAKQAIPAYFQYETQRDIMDMNIARAKQGLPPIDPGVVAPQVKVIHDVPPAVQTSILDFKAGATKIALWGGLGLIAFFMLRRVL